MRSLAWVLVCLGCGRVSFDERGDLRDAFTAPSSDASTSAPALLITGSGPANELLSDVAFHPSGALAVVGGFASTIELRAVGRDELAGATATTSASLRDMLTAVVEPDGAVRWLEHIGASTIGLGMNVGWVGDDIVAGGYFEGTASRIGSPSSGSGQNALIAHYAADGAFLSQRNWGGSNNVQLRALESTAERVVFGGVYAGSFSFGAGTLPSTNGADNGFLVTMAADGGDVVSRAFNGSSDVYVNDAALLPDGGVCITGRFNATTDLGGGPVMATGSTVFVACYDERLAFRWARTFGAGATGNYLAATPDGDCIALGTFSGTITLDGTSRTSVGGDDVYLVRFDGATGAAEWVTSIGGPGTDSAIGVVGVPPDRIAIAGRITGPAMLFDELVETEGDSDGFVALLSGDGTKLHTELLRGTGNVLFSFSGIAVDALASRIAFSFAFSGELRVRELSTTAVAEDGALVILPVAAP